MSPLFHAEAKITFEYKPTIVYTKTTSFWGKLKVECLGGNYSPH